MGLCSSVLKIYDNLLYPPEVLEMIVDKLSVQDKLVCRRVCKSWNNYIISNPRSFAPNSVAICIGASRDEKKIEDNFKFLGERKWNYIDIKNFGMTNSIYKGIRGYHYADFITVLKISSITPQESDEYYQWNKPAEERICPNLKSLTFDSCSADEFDDMIWPPIKIELFHKYICISNLEHLSFFKSERLIRNDRALFSFLFNINKLVSLEIDLLNFYEVHKYEYPSFYPKYKSKMPDHYDGYNNQYLMLKTFMRGYLLTPRGKSLKNLSMNFTKFYDKYLKRISSPDDFQWSSISLIESCRIGANTINDFFGKQRLTLKSFRHTPYLNARSTFNENYSIIDCSNIESLQLYSMELSLMKIKTLKNIKDLKIGSSDYFIRSIVENLCTDLPNPLKLRSLSLRNTMGLSDAQREEIYLRSPCKTWDCLSSIRNLTYLSLNLNSFVEEETTALFQSIIKNLKALHTLKVSAVSVKISDLAIAGRCIDDYESIFKDGIEFYYNFVREQYNKYKDAPHGESLSSLKCLRHLKLHSFEYVGMATWLYGLDLPLLENLEIPYCSIGYEGLNCIVRNCKSLVKLNILGCNTINDDRYITEFLSPLPRLRNVTGTVKVSFPIF